MSDDSEYEDTISLEDLVKEEAPPSIAGAPVSNSAQGSSSETNEVQENQDDLADGEEAGELSQEETEGILQIDGLLAEEDPEFSSAMQELKSQSIDSEGVDVDDSDIDRVVEDSKLEIARSKTLKGRLIWPFKKSMYLIRTFGSWLLNSVDQGWNWWTDTVLPWIKKLSKMATEWTKQKAVQAKGSSQNLLTTFKSMPRSSKLLVVSVGVLGLLLVIVLRALLSGPLLPRIGSGYLFSFTPIADARYEFNPLGSTETFDNPLLHPEHVVLIERMILSLRRTRENASPMGFLEIYVEVSNRETAIEVKDREGEARDIVSRVVEQMTYDELISPRGKNKMKTTLRKSLNDFVTKGRVRRVYIKTIVLKP